MNCLITKITNNFDPSSYHYIIHIFTQYNVYLYGYIFLSSLLRVEINHTHLYEDSDGRAIFLRVDRRTETNFGSFNYLVSVVI